MKKIGNFLKTSVRKTDLFPQKVSLTFKGKESFQTLYGGIISLIILTILISYSARIFAIMFQKQQTQKTLNRVIKDIQNNPPEYELNRNNFAFAFVLQDLTTGRRGYDPSYFNISIVQNTVNFDQNTGERTSQIEDRSFSTCGDNFPYVDESFQKTKNLAKNILQCVDNQNFTVKGSAFSDSRKFVSIRVERCVNGTSVVCKSPAQIKNKIQNSSFIVAFISQYFDFEDYNNPSKTVFETGHSVYLNLNFHKTKTYTIQKAEVNDVNHYFQFGQSEQSEFFMLGEQKSDFKENQSGDSELLTITLNQDSQVFTYERTIFSFLDAISQIGGVFGMLLQLGFILTSFFNQKYFLTSLFAFLYTSNGQEFETDLNKNERIYPKEKGANKKDINCNPNDTVLNLKLSKSLHDDRDFALSKNQQDKDRTNVGLNAIKSNFKNLRRTCFTTSEYLKILLPFCSSRAKRKFDLHSDQFSRECDVVELIHSIRTLKLMVRTVLKEHQRMLMGFSTKGQQNEHLEMFSLEFNSIPRNNDEPSKEFKGKVEDCVQKCGQVNTTELENDSKRFC
ncbi:unnamed protein product [Moneuplotes crassus]|uniref:Transmembrane protein n=1 Tax=Euplotes crassus TaxID=5936 RepID=A0AAD1X393_EUPCR|nr:unnamed protein product [Moneuplotes crassus]